MLDVLFLDELQGQELADSLRDSTYLRYKLGIDDNCSGQSSSPAEKIEVVIHSLRCS